jgi:hypothetical protein
MKMLVTTVTVLAGLLLVTAAPAGFLPTGEVYQDADGERGLTIRSWSAVRFRDGSETFRGTFEMLAGDQVKVTLETPEGPRSLYFLRIEEGLFETEPNGKLGRLLFDRDHLGLSGGKFERQKKTVVQIRKVGAAWQAWLADQLGAVHTGSGEGTYDVSELTNVISGHSLLQTLFPDYIQHVPDTDGWGHDLEYLHADDVLDPMFMAIRSPGLDGAFEASEYPIAPFKQTQYSRDVVWGDGEFIRYPRRRSE